MGACFPITQCNYRPKDKNLSLLDRRCIVRILIFLDPVEAHYCLYVSRSWYIISKSSYVWGIYGNIYFSRRMGILHRIEVLLSGVKRKQVRKWNLLSILSRSDSLIVSMHEFGRRYSQSIANINIDLNNTFNTLDDILYMITSESRIAVLLTLLTRIRYVMDLVKQRRFSEVESEINEISNLLMTIN